MFLRVCQLFELCVDLLKSRIGYVRVGICSRVYVRILSWKCLKHEAQRKKKKIRERRINSLISEIKTRA